jgi:uncharacterized protein YjbI with pentapeptide repeats
MLFACPLYSRAEEEASTQTKDILLNNGAKVIKVSIEDIKERLLKGEPVILEEEQVETKRTIKAEWITDVLKKEYGVKDISINNAIITGDLDFHINDNLVDIDDSGMDVDEIKKLKERGLERVFLVSSSIKIEDCQLQGSLKAGHDKNLKSFVIFKKPVVFSNSTVKEADFSYAKLNGEVRFWESSFNGKADFGFTSFNGRANFGITNFNGRANFGFTSFNVEAYFFKAICNGEAYFYKAGFKESANFEYASFNRKAGFEYASFNGKAKFRFTEFKEMADFWFASFNSKANFWKTSFNGIVDFGSATFEDIAIFREAEFKEEVIFSGANFTKSIDLIRAKYPIMRVSWSQLDGLLDRGLHDPDDKESGILNILREVQNKAYKDGVIVSKYLIENIDYLEKLQVDIVVNWEELYLKLVKNFEDLGDKFSADACYNHYRSYKSKFKIQRLGVTSEKLDVLPFKLEFPKNIVNSIEYSHNKLVFKGVMTDKDKETLLGLPEKLPSIFGVYLFNTEILNMLPDMNETAGYLKSKASYGFDNYALVSKRFKELEEKMKYYLLYNRQIIKSYKRAIEKLYKNSKFSKEYIVGYGNLEKTKE